MVMRPSSLFATCAAAVLATACGAPAPPPGTGGVDTTPSVCGRGVVVVQSDYQSTNVSLIDNDGAVLSSSFVSSASAQVGLSAALSGDVAPPTSIMSGAELALIDRYPASVVTFVDLATAQVRGQLDVSTGFASNPQDFIVVGQGRGYVSRYEGNTQPGNEPFDDGNDQLLVDTSAIQITGRIDMMGAVADGDYLPRSGRMERIGDLVFALLGAYSADFSDSAPSRLVAIDVSDNSIRAVSVLAGLHGCGAMAAWGDAATPDGTLAVACSGKFGGGATPSTGEAGVVVLDTLPDGTTLERARWTAADLPGRPPGFSVTFAGRDRLLLTLLGSEGDATPDALIEIDVASDTVTTVLESESPFQLGDVRCIAGVGCDSTTCYLAHAEQGVVHRLDASAVPATIAASLVVDTSIGLPPRMLGRY